jgi:integrase/recombinase XerD
MRAHKVRKSHLRAWLAVRGQPPVTELFVNARDQPMTRSGFEYVLEKHVQVAAEHCPSLKQKRVSPHVLRHAAAMLILQATGDIRKVSLWLGHADIQTTEVYLRADPTEKLEAISALMPTTLKRGRFRPPDKLIASLCVEYAERWGPNCLSASASLLETPHIPKSHISSNMRFGAYPRRWAKIAP